MEGREGRTTSGRFIQWSSLTNTPFPARLGYLSMEDNQEEVGKGGTPQTRRQGTQSLSLSLQTSEEDFPDEFMTVNLATNQSRNRLVNEMENCFLVSLKLTFDGFPSPRLESPP